VLGREVLLLLLLLELSKEKELVRLRLAKGREELKEEDEVDEE
jgi:hypothetical protein